MNPSRDKFIVEWFGEKYNPKYNFGKLWGMMRREE